MSIHPSTQASHERIVPFFTAIVAVLAALGTLYSHHRSIQALALRNDAVLLTAKASDQYNYYQTQQLKVTLYQALKMPKEASQEQSASLPVYSDAKALEERADGERDHAEALLNSFETLEIATTLFEIAIAFASIAALTYARIPLWLGAGLTLAGLVLGLYGYFQAH